MWLCCIVSLLSVLSQPHIATSCLPLTALASTARPCADTQQQLGRITSTSWLTVSCSASPSNARANHLHLLSLPLSVTVAMGARRPNSPSLLHHFQLILQPCLSSPCALIEPTHALLGRLSRPRDAFVPGDVCSAAVTPSAWLGQHS
jgi:hypothetical protein